MNDWQSNPFTGIFTHFGTMQQRAYDPACVGSAGDAVAWLPKGESTTSGGIGWDNAMAEGACVGEAIERLQCGPVPDDSLIDAAFEGWPLDELAVDPGQWILFHPEQYYVDGFSFRPLTRKTKCAWGRCRQALTGEPRWVPAEMIYLHLPAGHRFAPGYSTGLACGRVGDPLLLRGLQEVIERDAVMGAWWGRYLVEEYLAGGVFKLLGEEVRTRISRPNLTYRWYRVASPFSDNVTMVTLEGEDREGYCFSIGASCRETRSASWTKSLLEAIHGRHYVRYLKTQIEQGTLKLGRWPRSYAEHAVWYSMHPQTLGSTILHTKPATEQSESTGSEPITLLIERLGPERLVLFRSMTPPALASEKLGWHVVRVVVPGLQPMHGHHAYPHLGGWLWSPRGLADWRAMPPHPFP